MGELLAASIFLLFALICWLCWIVFSRGSKELEKEELGYAEATILQYEDQGKRTSLIVNFSIDSHKSQSICETYPVNRKDFPLNSRIPISYKKKDLETILTKRHRVVVVNIELPHIKESVEKSHKIFLMGFLILAIILSLMALVFLSLGIVKIVS